MLVDKQNKRFPIIDIACRSDRRVDTKQEEKVNKYLGRELEIKEPWKVKSVEIVPVVFGELGTIPRSPEH